MGDIIWRASLPTAQYASPIEGPSPSRRTQSSHVRGGRPPRRYWALLNVIGAILMGVACVNHIVLSYLLLKASCCSDGRSRGSGGGRARQGGGGRGGIDWSNNNSYAGGSDSFRGAGGGLRV